MTETEYTRITYDFSLAAANKAELCGQESRENDILVLMESAWMKSNLAKFNNINIDFRSSDD
jgi:hypothetical protein